MGLQAVLAETVTGIYCGWASIGSSSTVYQMVMSIGWNPFYKNTEKTAEPWLLHEFPEDFYGEQLRLAVSPHHPGLLHRIEYPLLRTSNVESDVSTTCMHWTRCQLLWIPVLFLKMLRRKIGYRELACQTSKSLLADFSMSNTNQATSFKNGECQQ